MSLEAALAENTAAVKALTAALASGDTPAKPRAAKTAVIPPATPAQAIPAPVAPVAAAPAAAPATARAATADTAPPVTPAQIKAAGDDLSLLAEADRATAVAILGEFGVQKMTAMPSSSIPEFHARVKAALNKGAAPSLV